MSVYFLLNNSVSKYMIQPLRLTRYIMVIRPLVCPPYLKRSYLTSATQRVYLTKPSLHIDKLKCLVKFCSFYSCIFEEVENILKISPAYQIKWNVHVPHSFAIHALIIYVSVSGKHVHILCIPPWIRAHFYIKMGSTGVYMFSFFLAPKQT